MQWLKDLLVLLKSEYLELFWWLLAGYAVSYLLAHLMARTLRRTGYTLVYRCRQAWGVALLTHALGTVGVAGYWYAHNGLFPSFWRFFSFYLVMLILDLVLVVYLVASRNRYADYYPR